MNLVVLALGLHIAARPPTRCTVSMRAKDTLEAADAEEAAALNEAAAAAGALARSAETLAATRAAAEERLAALRTELDAGGALAKAMESAGSGSPPKKVAKALKKPKGSLAIVPEGVPVDAMSLGGIDLDDPAYIGESSRDGNAAAVCVRVSGPSMLTADALAATVAEQETARGDFPGPLPVISRDDVVDTLQLAKAKADGAGAVVLNVVLNGAEKTKELFDQARNSSAQFFARNSYGEILRRNSSAQRRRNFLTPRSSAPQAGGLGLEAIVRVADAAELTAAVDMGAAIVCIGDCALPTAVELLGQLPDGVVSVCDVELPDVRGAWAVRDEKFNAMICGKGLLEVCARDRVPPAAVIKAMNSKGSVKFGLGMQKGRMEGAKEQLGTLSM